jgi:periplasmic divalent cation tolerance protein
MSEIVIAFTTLPAEFDVLTLARELVAARVAACVSVLPPVQSVYEWEGTVTIDREQQLQMKTTRSKVADLWEALRARHPYQVPEFLVLPVTQGNPAYLNWVRTSVG